MSQSSSFAPVWDFSAWTPLISSIRSGYPDRARGSIIFFGFIISIFIERKLVACWMETRPLTSSFETSFQLSPSMRPSHAALMRMSLLNGEAFSWPMLVSSLCFPDRFIRYSTSICFRSSAVDARSVCAL